MKFLDLTEDVTVTKLVHGGQALGELADGRKVFLWNALPGERVRARISKMKRSYAEGIAEDILTVSSERVIPREENYLATSPWQMMTSAYEQQAKHDIVMELFAHEHVTLPDVPVTIHDTRDWAYRNKMEYSFWGDEVGLHLALHQRGSHGKQIVEGSALAIPSLDEAAQALLAELNRLDMRGSDLKTVVLRVSQTNKVVAALFIKDIQAPDITLPTALQGLRVYYSNPKSPASVPTKLIIELGDVTLTDEILGKSFSYDVDSFFQVNVPIYSLALARLKEACLTDPLDMYAGVGSIGLSVAKEHVELIEIDPATAAMAQRNFAASGLKGSVQITSSEAAVDAITSIDTVIFDPPRAGLHPKVVEQVRSVKPPQLIYLSCNPATQARDLQQLQSEYTIDSFEVYNFFPRTPHIETLAILNRR